MDRDADLRYPGLTQDKRVLCLAALFEDEFSLDWIEELTGARASFALSVLEDGVDKGWLSRRRPAIYCFTDEARRKELEGTWSPEEYQERHREIADILIRELPDEGGSVLTISRHLLRVPVDWRGCQWLMRAAKILVASLATAKALTCYTHVLAGLSGGTGESEDRLFIEAAMEHSHILAGRSQIDRSVAFLLEAGQRAKRIHDRRCEILLEMHLAKCRSLASGFDQALEGFKKAFAKAEALGDPHLLRAAAMFHTYSLFWQGRFKDVIDVYERSVPEVDRYPTGQFPLMAAIIAGHCYGMTGQANQGLGLLDAIRNHCLRNGEVYLSSHATAAIAMVMLSVGRVDEALKYLKKGLKEAEESNNRFARSITSLILALLYHSAGDTGRAAKYLRSFHRQGAVAGVGSVLIPYLLEARWTMRSPKMARFLAGSFDSEIAHALKQRNPFLKGVALRYEAVAGLQEGRRPAEMARLLTRSLGHLRVSGNCSELGKSYIELGRLYFSAGDDRRGKAMLRTASEILAPINPELIPDDLRALIGDEYHEAPILTDILNSRHYLGPAGYSKKVFQWALTTANRLIGAERAALLLCKNAQSSELQLKASKNLTEEEIEAPGSADSRKVIAEVMTSGKGRIVPGCINDEELWPAAAKSRICVPLMLDGKALGVFYHENRLLSSVFREWHLDLLAFFASVVITNLRRERPNAIDGEKEAPDRRDEAGGGPTNTEQFPMDGIVGSSRTMRQVLRAVEEVAQTDATVLILGETGVGKNLVAAAIHRQSKRERGPFVTVQCSALTESLITSELFGHEKGAFTGATDRRIGRFELADKGTLFLDEIGDLSPEVQARLLRVLQTKEFERVGGGKRTITSDFRLIAATNRDLVEEVRQKRFREDLYYRISVLPLYVPPLRERREDIPSLAQHFLAIHAAQQRSGTKRLTQEVMDRLVAHDWPGNIRELENVIQRGLLVSKRGDLQLPLFETTRSTGTTPTGLKRLDQVEHDHILSALEARGWKVRGPGGVAEALAINPSTLRARMKKLGLVRPTP